jgi:hypothetical protein
VPPLYQSIVSAFLQTKAVLNPKVTALSIKPKAIFKSTVLFIQVNNRINITDVMKPKAKFKSTSV